MALLYNTFDFTGKIFIPDKEKFHAINESDSGWVGHRLSFAVQESQTNSVFVEMYGGYSRSKPNVVYSFSKSENGREGQRIEIPWSDRLKPEVVDMVANFRKIVVDFTTDQEAKKKATGLRYKIRDLEYKENKTEEELNELTSMKQELKELVPERYEFIHPYDAIAFLQSHLPVYKKHKFRVRGNVEMSEHKGEFYRKFVPNLIEIVDEDTPSKLKAFFDIFFTKDSLDDKRIKKEQRVYVNGYILSYDSKTKKDQFFPMQFVINTSKIDFENERQVALLELLKNKFKVTGRGVYHLPWDVNIFRGAEEKEFTENDLTTEQRELIEFGLATIDDFKPKGSVLGEAYYENRLIKPILQAFDAKENNFVNGPVETDYRLKDLEFEFVGNSTSKQTEDKISESEAQTKETDPLDDLDDLFS